APPGDECLRPVHCGDAHEAPGRVAIQRRRTRELGIPRDDVAAEVRSGFAGQLDLPGVLIAPHVTVARAADGIVRQGDVVRDGAGLLDRARPVLVPAVTPTRHVTGRPYVVGIERAAVCVARHPVGHVETAAGQPCGVRYRPDADDHSLGGQRGAVGQL